jgi:hypothetical protein
MKTTIWVTSRFAAFHRWVDAPKSTLFLRDFHRHVFHVKLSVRVSHQNRQVEFFDLKSRLEKYLDEMYVGKRFELSCEQIAADLLRRFSACWCEVSEDGENGAVVEQGDVAAEIRTSPFVGVEAEGPRRGLKTLFVPGCCNPQEVRQAAAKSDAVYAYYGAGNVRSLREDSLAELRKLFPDERLTVEVAGEVPPILNGSSVLTVSLSPGAAYIKTVGNGCVQWICNSTGEIYITLLDDPLFSQDQEIL